MHRFELQVVRAARANGVRTVIRGEFTDVLPDRGRSALRTVARDMYLRWFYRYLDMFCYVGEEARRHLRRLGIPPARMVFAPYSVDTELLEAQRRAVTRHAARAALHIPEDHCVLLFSGKLIPRKAPLLLIRALQQVSEGAQLMLVMLGDGELREAVETAARAILGDRLRMVGFVNQSQLGRYYAAADVLVLPSHFETWGLVVNEAMQFGLPAIVSSKVGCHRDLVIEGQTGMVFPQGDADALSRCIRRVASEPGLAKRLGENARQRIVQYSTAASAAGIRKAVGLS